MSEEHEIPEFPERPEHEYRSGSLPELDAFERAANTITAWRVDEIDDDLDGIATRWTRLRALHREIGLVVDDFATVVGRRLADVEYERKTGYQLPNGELIHHASSSTDRWSGRQLLLDLGTQLVDPDTGEQLHAIPVDVLEQIVPGTATDKLTSSKWSTRGLSNLGIDPDDYRTREWKIPKAQLGPARA